MRLLLVGLSLVLMVACTSTKKTCCDKTQKTEKTCHKVENDKNCHK